MVCQKEAPIWLPCTPQEVSVLMAKLIDAMETAEAGSTYTLAGLDVQNLTHVDLSRSFELAMERDGRLSCCVDEMATRG